MSTDEERAMWAGKLAAATDEELAHHYDEVGTIGMNAAQIKRARAYFAAPERGRPVFPVGLKGERNELRSYPISLIQIAPTRRTLDETVVNRLVESIGNIGLIHPPIVVRRDRIEVDGEEEDGIPVLVAGRHRLEAWRRLGNRSIPCVVVDADEIDAELLEISENLHRAELTALQRDEQIARWIELTSAKREVETVSAQVAPKSPGRPESGINAAARELGIERTAAQRAVKVASLSPEAKQVAVDTGLDNNRTVLIAAAKLPEPEKQVEVIRVHAKPVAKPSDPEVEVRIRAREEREKVELAKFLTTVDAVEPLLAELKSEDEVSIYDKLTYLQVAERYKPILALRAYLWRVGYGKTVGDASRRIEDARGDILRILTDKAEDEIEPAQADTFDGAPIPRTPEVDLEAA